MAIMQTETMNFKLEGSYNANQAAEHAGDVVTVINCYTSRYGITLQDNDADCSR